VSCCDPVKRERERERVQERRGRRNPDLECFDSGRLFANEKRMMSFIDFCVKGDGIWWKVIEVDGFSL